MLLFVLFSRKSCTWFTSKFPQVLLYIMSHSVRMKMGAREGMDTGTMYSYQGSALLIVFFLIIYH